MMAPPNRLGAVLNGVGALGLHEATCYTLRVEPKVIGDYIQGFRVSQGRLAGSYLTVWPWERRFIRGAFAPDTLTAGLSVGRGNGKSTLLAAVATATVPPGPLWVPRGETVIVASSFEQARISFEHCQAFLSDELEADRARRVPDRKWRVWDTAQQARIEHRATGARIRCIGSDPKRAHGLAPTLVLADEPAQWPPTTGEKMVSALRTAAGKQPFSRLIGLGTRPDDPQHWFSRLLADGADYSQIHAARPDDPPGWARTWARANPSMRYLPDLEHAIRSEYAAAKRDPSLMSSFESLRLNLGTPDTDQAVLISAELWRDIEGSAPMSGPVVWGVDLGSSAAQSAVAAFWPETGALAVVAAFPTVPSLEKRGHRDGVAGLYRQCFREGSLITVGKRTADVTELVREALARFGRPAVVASDRWRRAELADALEAARVPPGVLSLRGMGYRDGGEDVRLFVRACAEGRVTPARSLLLRSALSVARTVSDPAGNVKISKTRRRARDDAAVAVVLAVAAGVRRYSAGPKRRRRRVLVV